MAGYKEDTELSHNLQRLGFEVGSLRFHMRNDYLVSESLLFAPPTKIESQAKETLHFHSEDHKPENLEKEIHHHSLADKILTDFINNSKDCVDGVSLCSEYLKILSKIEAELLKKVDDLLNRNEETYSHIIRSIKL